VTIPGHPYTQHNVVPPPTISSLIGGLLASHTNSNLVWEEYSHQIAIAEVEMIAMTSSLLGYDPLRAGGLFTFGGTGTALYGLKVALEKAIPGSMEHGVREDVVIFSSDASYYCRYNIAGWLGVGFKNLRTIATDSCNPMKISVLREQSVALLRSGQKLGGFIATLGSTDAFGLDDLGAMVALRDELVAEF